MSETLNSDISGGSSEDLGLLTFVMLSETFRFLFLFLFNLFHKEADCLSGSHMILLFGFL